MSKILVMGGTNNIGLALINQLLENNHEITIATRGIKKNPFDNVKHLIIKRNDYNNNYDLFNGKKYDVIYDNTAYSPVYISNLLDNVECDHYIMLSSSAVYYPIRDNIVESSYDPLNEKIEWIDYFEKQYGYCKRMTEAALIQKYGKNNNTIIRIPYIIDRRIDFFIKEITTNKTIKSKTENVSFTSIKGLINTILELTRKKQYGIYNYCDLSCQFDNIINYIGCKLGKDVKIDKNCHLSPYNDISFYLNTDKIEKITKSKEKLFWEELDDRINRH